MSHLLRLVLLAFLALVLLAFFALVLLGVSALAAPIAALTPTAVVAVHVVGLADAAAAGHAPNTSAAATPYAVVDDEGAIAPGAGRDILFVLHA